MAGDVTPTVAEAERLLEEARRAEGERAAALARQVEENRRRQAEFETDAIRMVNALENRVMAAVVAAEDAEVVPSRALRKMARGWLHGFAAPYGHDAITPEDVLAINDPTASLLLGMVGEAAQVYEQLTDENAGVFWGVDHPLALRVDNLEVTAWKAFVEHVRSLAGE